MKFDESIEKIEEIIGYRFRDRSLLKQAFTRSSFCNEQGRLSLQSNEVLEFIGDSALSTAIITLLMKERSTRDAGGLRTTLEEGDFSNIKAALSNKHNLAVSTERLGLEKYLSMGEGDERLGVRSQPSVMEDLFESIIGAVFVDSGMSIEPVIASVEKMLDTSVYDFTDARRAVPQSAKNELQEWCAKKTARLPAPVYKTLSESGPDHQKIFLRGCYIGDELYGRGEGKNTKSADAAAAAEALKKLKSELSQSLSSTEYTERLRRYAAEAHAAPPEYSDLGETERSTASEREFRCECRLLGKRALGIGKSKREAKKNAAEALLSLIESEN